MDLFSELIRNIADTEVQPHNDLSQMRKGSIKPTLSILSGQIKFAIWNVQIVIDYSCNEQSICLQVQPL